jgi:hypothetical protein
MTGASQPFAPTEACAETVWLDGVYRTTCGRAIVQGECGTHGKNVLTRPFVHPTPNAPSQPAD